MSCDDDVQQAQRSSKVKPRTGQTARTSQRHVGKRRSRMRSCRVVAARPFPSLAPPPPPGRRRRPCCCSGGDSRQALPSFLSYGNCYCTVRGMFLPSSSLWRPHHYRRRPCLLFLLLPLSSRVFPCLQWGYVLEAYPEFRIAHVALPFHLVFFFFPSRFGSVVWRQKNAAASACQAHQHLV